MLDSKERKEARLHSGLPDALSPAAYNATMLGLVLYGFVVNALMVHFLAPALAGIDRNAYIIFLIGYFISVIAGTFMAASDKPALSFIGYNLIVLPIGVLLSITLPGYGAALVMQAILLTGAITLVMLILGTVFPQVFAGMGRALGVALLVSCLLSLASWFFAGISDVLVWVTAVIFTLYIGYDVQKAQRYPKTPDNAIDSAIDLYLDIINLFLKILRILSRLRDND